MKKSKSVLLILFCFLFAGSAFAASNMSIDTSRMEAVQKNSGMSVNKPEFNTDEYAKKYKKVTKDGAVMQALEVLQTVNLGKYSYNAIMGNNITGKPIKIEFKNLAEINPQYASFEALGWRKADRFKSQSITDTSYNLYIYINEKHRGAPPEAIAAVLAHEAIHQDSLSSLNEETYAWTLEAGVWMKLAEKNPNVINDASPLVTRENMLKKLYEKGDYTNKYIKKAVFTNPGYKDLPTRSPGFEDEDL